MVDVRRIIVIFVIAILFSIFVNVMIEAIYPSPDYEDFCGRERMVKPMPVQREGIDCPSIEPTQELLDACPYEKGDIQYKYDSNGCATEVYCETCGQDLDAAQSKYNLIVFIVSAIAGLLALVAGLYLPQKTNPINEWVGSGFLLGGIFTIFVGTMRYFGDMGRFVRPIVIFIELVLVIYLAYKKLGKKK